MSDKNEQYNFPSTFQNATGKHVGDIIHGDKHIYLEPTTNAERKRKWFLEGSVFLAATKTLSTGTKELREMLEEYFPAPEEKTDPPLQMKNLEDIFKPAPSLVHLCLDKESLHCLDRNGQPVTDVENFVGYIQKYYKSPWVLILCGCSNDSDVEKFRVKEKTQDIREYGNCVIALSSKMQAELVQIFCKKLYSTLSDGETLDTAYDRAFYDICGGYGLEKNCIFMKGPKEIALFTGTVNTTITLYL